MKHTYLKMSAPGDIALTIFDPDNGTTTHPAADTATLAHSRVMSPNTDSTEMGLARFMSPSPGMNMEVSVFNEQMVLRDVWTPCLSLIHI